MSRSAVVSGPDTTPFTDMIETSFMMAASSVAATRRRLNTRLMPSPTLGVELSITRRPSSPNTQVPPTPLL